MNFEQVILLHGKGGSPEGSVRDIARLLSQHYRDKSPEFFQRPRMLHADPQVTTEESLAQFAATAIPHGTLLIGVSLGGLVAAKLQEQQRPDLPVICLNSPTWADGVTLGRRMPDRLSFYSSGDNVIAGRTANWPRLAMAFDLPWLTHDTSQHAHQLAPLIIAWIEGRSVPHAIDRLESEFALGSAGR